MSQESLFGFLTSTRLPVVSSLSGLVRWISLGLWVSGLVFGLTCLLLADDGLWSASLPWSGALPALTSAPLFFLAWRDWRSNRMQRGATMLFVAMFTLCSLATWPRGAFSAVWYLHPVLSLLSATCLGVKPGLSLTLLGVATLLGNASWSTSRIDVELRPDLWVHVASLSAVSLASALTGAITNRVVFMALLSVEAQRRKNFESSRALRHREKLLRHALRVETVGDLAGMVCHQLRNAFQVLAGHVTLGGLSDDAERVRRLAMIEQTLEDTRPLLDQLMLMAHPDEGITEPCDLAAAMRQFHEQARRMLPASIQLNCEVPRDTPIVLLNARGLGHALWNLVINSRQAIQGEGAITLCCGADRHQVWLEVTDSGCGMSKEVQERIFDPYFTTKPPGQGTGLGLTAVARFVRSSNGLIQVESEVGRGTTFRLQFPRAMDAENWRTA
ncbi:MAG TPA: HAMP domain-containing sensor histidine kinase [Planctomycetota bacterium]